MKLGIALSAIIDLDFADTIDARFGYSDALAVFMAGTCDDLAQDWLNALDQLSIYKGPESEAFPLTLRSAA